MTQPLTVKVGKNGVDATLLVIGDCIHVTMPIGTPVPVTATGGFVIVTEETWADAQRAVSERSTRRAKGWRAWLMQYLERGF